MAYWHTDDATGETYFDWSHLWPLAIVPAALLDWLIRKVW